MDRSKKTRLRIHTTRSIVILVMFDDTTFTIFDVETTGLNAKGGDRIVEIAGRSTPWRPKCLVEAIMVRTLLAYYRIPYVLHLGARPRPIRA